MGGSPSASEPHRPADSPAVPQYRRGAKARITSGDAVLLIKERHTDGTPFWTLPGGGVRPEESLVEGLCRELREELGCRSPVVGERAGRMVYAHHSEPHRVSLYTVFDSRLQSEPRPNRVEGIESCRWIRPDAVPPRTLPQVRALCW